MNIEELKNVFEELHEPPFRFAQAKRAFYVETLSGWEEVTTFPKKTRDALAARIPWSSLTPVRTQTSTSGDTVKTLFACADGKNIEAVLMRHEDGRNTVCVSCQVGCPMACAFCATGTMGFKRNLTVEEIVDQVMHFARLVKPEDARITNVVFMGMGEPMHTYDTVLAAIRELHDPDGFNLGSRHFTISTCGIVPGILRLADEPMQINLAISLHSAVDETRSKIMPVNRAYPVKKLMAAVDAYAEKTNRKVFFEYVLLDGINDSPEEAQAVANLLRHNIRLFHVNLIKYHDTQAFTGTATADRMSFMDRLKKFGIPVTHRVTFGEDIDAACGQLVVAETPGDVDHGQDAKAANAERRTPERV